MTKFNLKKKQNKLRIISKPHAHLYTMTEESVKFQENQLTGELRNYLFTLDVKTPE